MARGSFGEAWEAWDEETNERVVLKRARSPLKRKSIAREATALRALEGCARVPRLLGVGPESSYLVLPRYGSSLDHVRRYQEGSRLLPEHVGQVGCQVVAALEEIHDLGYLHRDLKPSNILLESNYGREISVILVDFGLARRYLDEAGGLLPPRPVRSPTGTVRYLSLPSHDLHDHARRDDLWSFWYSLLELHEGFLPWRKVREKADVRQAKLDLNEILPEAPPPLAAFAEELRGLAYEDRPPYGRLIQVLEELR